MTEQVTIQTTEGEITLDRFAPADMILDLAAHFGITIKMWLPEDMNEYLEKYPEETRNAIKGNAYQNNWWNQLEDATDGDWYLVECSVSEAAEALGVKPLKENR